jgi:FkbM family methyltransferase
MIRAAASSWPPHKYVRKFHRRVLDLRQRLVREIELIDGPSTYRFRCETVRELNRCLNLFTKEPGTLNWIKSEFQPGQVFFDIGANMGVYTILAARQLAPGGKVYAFEPHGPNFARLIDNILCNQVQRDVIPSNFALHDSEGYLDFNYESVVAGTSNSQLAPSPDALAGGGSKGIVELKHATSVDRLIDSGRAVSPHHVKIDVDGNEYLILQGMTTLLGSPQAPLTLQVEMNEPYSETIVAFMRGHRYDLSETHYSRSAAEHKEHSGENPSTGCNAIFRKRQ